MKEFYLEQVRDLERQVRFIKVGYMQEMKILGARLTSCSFEESETIVNEIRAAAKAMKELEDSYEYYLKEYHKEVEKSNGGRNNENNK